MQRRAHTASCQYSIQMAHLISQDLISGHKSNAVCTVIVKHFNAQSDHSPKLRDNITYSISVMDRHCSRSETSHFVDRSPLISVHDITTCMNVHGRYIILERLKNMHKQQTVFISVFTCKVLCFAETGSIRSKTFCHAHKCHQDCPLGAQNLIILCSCVTAIYIYSQTNVKESVTLVLVAQSCLSRKG